MKKPKAKISAKQAATEILREQPDMGAEALVTAVKSKYGVNLAKNTAETYRKRIRRGFGVKAKPKAKAADAKDSIMSLLRVVAQAVEESGGLLNLRDKIEDVDSLRARVGGEETLNQILDLLEEIS